MKLTFSPWYLRLMLALIIACMWIQFGIIASLQDEIDQYDKALIHHHKDATIDHGNDLYNPVP